MAKGDDLQERMVNFGVSITNICARLPKNSAGTHFASQLLRCGTAAAPNYAEARGGESRKDFIHKLGVVLKELNECNAWLEMIKRSELLASDRLDIVVDECRILCRIVAASINTASGKAKRTEIPRTM